MRKSFIISNYDQWKANEFRVFFLYLCVPVMYHYLDIQYFRNLLRFVLGKNKHFVKGGENQVFIVIFLNATNFS